MRGPGPEWYEVHAQYRKNFWLDLDTLNWNHRQLLRDRPNRGGRLLDIGCGSGRFLAAAARLGYGVTGIDFNPEAIRIARDRFGLRDLYCGTPEAFMRDRPDARFDVVTAFEVLEHVERPAQFVGDARELIRGGGYLAITVPYKDRWPRTRSTMVWDVPPHHLTRWNKRSLATALSSAGLRVVRVTTGWPIGEEVLHYYIRFGVIDRLFRRVLWPNAGDGERKQLAMVASRLMRSKRAGLRIAAAPLNLVLGALGSTGLGMYSLALRP